MSESQSVIVHPDHPVGQEVPKIDRVHGGTKRKTAEDLKRKDGVIDGEWREVEGSEFKTDPKKGSFSIEDAIILDVAAETAEKIFEKATGRRDKHNDPEPEPEPKQEPKEDRKEEVQKEKRNTWEDIEKRLSKITDKKINSRDGVIAPRVQDEADTLKDERDEVWEAHKNDPRYRAWKKDISTEINAIIREDQEYRQRNMLMPNSIDRNDPLEEILKWIDLKINRVADDTLEEQIATSWWRGVRRNIEEQSLKSEQELREELEMPRAKQLDATIRKLDIRIDFLNWGSNKDETRAVWEKLGDARKAWLMEEEPSYKQRLVDIRSKTTYPDVTPNATKKGNSLESLFGGFDLAKFERAEWEGVEFPAFTKVNVASLPESWSEAEREWIAARVSLHTIRMARSAVPTNPDNLNIGCTLATLFKAELNTLTNTRMVGEAMAMIAYLTSTRDKLPTEFSDVRFYETIRSGGTEFTSDSRKKLATILEARFGDKLGISEAEGHLTRAESVVNVALALLQTENFFERKSGITDVSNLAFFRLMHIGQRLTQFLGEADQINPANEFGRWMNKFRADILSKKIPFFQESALFDSFFNYAFQRDIDMELINKGKELISGVDLLVTLNWNDLKLQQPGIKYWADIVDSARTLWGLVMTGKFPQGKGKDDVYNAITLLTHSNTDQVEINRNTREILGKLVWNAANPGSVSFNNRNMPKSAAGWFVDFLERTLDGDTKIQNL